jgi:hypothetical protein
MRQGTLVAERPAGRERPTRARARAPRMWRPQLALLLVYAGLAVLLTQAAWRSPATVALGGGDGDGGLFIWFLRWAPYALAHGQAPWFTDLLNAPHGVNVLWNTSLLLPAVLLAPVTLWLGPVVTFNVLLAAAPALSAWCGYLAICRWVPAHGPAALGGLVYGFSPALLAQSHGHLHMTLLMLPPLLLCLLEEALVRQRRPWPRVGLLFGLTAACQLLVGEEVLAFTALVALLGLLVLVAAYPRRVRARVPYALRSLALALCVFAALAAWPLAVQLTGAQHVQGDIHSGSRFASDLLGFVVPTAAQLVAPSEALRVSGRFTGNLAELDAYLGIPLVVLVLVVTVRWWSLAVVRVSGLLALGTALLSMGSRLHVGGRITGVPLPWAALEHLPLLQSGVANRLALLTVLFAALQLAFVVERAWRARRRVLAVLLALAVLVPLAPSGPLGGFAPVRTPELFSSGAGRIPTGSTALVVPYPRRGSSVAMAWHAQAGLRFKLAGGYFVGPGDGGRPRFGPGPSELSRILAELRRGARVPVVQGELRRQLVADLASLRVSTVIVGPCREQRATTELMRELIARPPERVGGVLAWFDVEPQALVPPPELAAPR